MAAIAAMHARVMNYVGGPTIVIQAFGPTCSAATCATSCEAVGMAPSGQDRARQRSRPVAKVSCRAWLLLAAYHSAPCTEDAAGAHWAAMAHRGQRDRRSSARAPQSTGSPQHTHTQMHGTLAAPPSHPEQILHGDARVVHLALSAGPGSVCEVSPARGPGGPGCLHGWARGVDPAWRLPRMRSRAGSAGGVRLGAYPMRLPAPPPNKVASRVEPPQCVAAEHRHVRQRTPARCARRRRWPPTALQGRRHC